MQRWTLIVALWLALAPMGRGDEPPRRVYALHSGVHIILAPADKNYAAKVLGNELKRRGLPARDVIVLDCPFPDASWKNMVPREGVTMFLDSMSTKSRVAHDAYCRMDKAFQAQGVGPKDEIVWIGHSAGGQMGLTMARLAADLTKHPELAKSARHYRFHTIVTLGSPIGCNEVPDDVKVIHYFSPQDKVVRIACDGGPWVLPKMGYASTICPCTPAPGKNCRARCWYDVQHPDWIDEPRVLNRMWQDLNGDDSSWWREPRAAERPGAALAQLLGQLAEMQFRLQIEELPGR